MITFGEPGSYAYIGLFFILGVMLGVGAYVTSWILRPKPKQEGMKLDSYECGEETIGPTWIQFNARYYVWALIFLVFDVETLFILPWALVYKGFQPISLAFVEMAIFLLILIVGLIYAWKKDVLKWN
jgi:NADH:ubiquinone oxidoreductase subunit 3 (subunit A)